MSGASASRFPGDSIQSHDYGRTARPSACQYHALRAVLLLVRDPGLLNHVNNVNSPPEIPPTTPIPSKTNTIQILVLHVPAHACQKPKQTYPLSFPTYFVMSRHTPERAVIDACRECQQNALRYRWTEAQGACCVVSCVKKLATAELPRGGHLGNWVD